MAQQSISKPLWLPSASSAVRVLHCPGSVVLPRDRASAPTPEMLRGSYLHLKLEQMLVGHQPQMEPRFDALTRDIPDEDLDALDSACTAIHRADILRGAELVSAEEAFAYHPATDSARSLGFSIERAYLQHGWRPTEEIAGTADVILRTLDGALLVGDFKTGHYDNQVSYAWGPQLDFLALMAARTYRVSTVTVGICLVMDDGRIHWTEERTLDLFDLELISLRIRDAVTSWYEARAQLDAGAVPVTKIGAWCDYCPSRSLCPAWRSLARTFAEDTAALALQDLTPESAGLAWEKLTRYDALAGEIRKQFKAYALRHPLVLEDGTRLGHVTRSREELDGAKTVEYLRRAYSTAKADEVCTVRVTKAALERTFGDKQAKEIVADLRKAGAVKRNEFTVMDVLKGKP